MCVCVDLNSITERLLSCLEVSISVVHFVSVDYNMLPDQSHLESRSKSIFCIHFDLKKQTVICISLIPESVLDNALSG